MHLHRLRHTGVIPSGVAYRYVHVYLGTMVLEYHVVPCGTMVLEYHGTRVPLVFQVVFEIMLLYLCVLYTCSTGVSTRVWFPYRSGATIRDDVIGLDEELEVLLQYSVPEYQW